MERINVFVARAQDRGASLVEYALLVALIAVVCIGAVTQLGNNTSDAHADAGSALGDGDGASGCEAYEGEFIGNLHVGTGDDAHGRFEAEDSCYGTIGADSFHSYLGYADLAG